MIIAVLKETAPFETRVAATPDIVKKYKSLGLRVFVEKGAGEAAGFADSGYAEAGAEIKNSAAETCRDADVIIKIRAPLPSEDGLMHSGQILVANLEARNQPERLKTLAHIGLTGFALELMPRISRAQNMDILSSQSSLAGYRAVINAVGLLNRAVPMMMTAAGTIPAAKVLVLGAGVAGLQAIATAKRLGAQVFASDVRPAVKEQVESLGGKFLEIETDETFETAGGYAGETSEDYRRRQQEAVATQLAKSDIVVTTALIPGKPAPRLISAEMLKAMPSGGVVIDMAAAAGGNVEGSRDNAVIDINGVTVAGNSNLAAEIPHSASRLFAQNIYNFLTPWFKRENDTFAFDFEDEIINKTCVFKNGQILL